MRITIAGASSFIGKRLIKLVEEEKHEIDDLHINAVIRQGSSYPLQVKNLKNISFIECDMEDYAKLGELVGPGDCFIDLTWKGSRGAARQDHDLQKLNYDCNMAALRSMADAGYTTLVSAGSQAEYGICQDVIKEETPCNPNTEYGKFKLRLYYETMELAEKKGIRFIEPRYFSLYGPGDYEKTLIMANLKKMLANEKIELNECTQLWDYMFVDDAMDGLLRLCDSDAQSGAYDFATGDHKTLREFILEMKDAVGSSSKIDFGAVHYDGLLINLRPDISKLKQATNWKPETSFAEGIRLTAESMKI